MKKLLLLFIAVGSLLTARADEGMWIPSLIGKNYDEMLRLGLKLSKDDLYSINHASLKDAIVQFGGGCTAEVVSGSGLLLTNHHCGYESIANLSTVDKNYLENGFWAHSIGEELPSAGLSVIFLESVQDVTDQMNHVAGKLGSKKYTEKLEAMRKKLEDAAAQKGKYVANIKDYFNGNQYLLLIYKKYTDVRLVGTPPRSLGKFGGDTDNWMWPRHTADFSMFRIYAGKDNEPANYAAGNVPYRPKKYLPVSAKGVHEGDYAMIYGYPGRTNRYEIAEGVDLAIKEVNPSIVSIRDTRLAIMKKHMQANPAVNLKLTSNYARIANYWKYYIGQTEQLKRLHIVDQKRNEEASFNHWAAKNKNEYRSLLNEYAAVYNNYRPYAKTAVYYNECFKGSALAKLAAQLEPLEKALKADKSNSDTIKKYVGLLRTARTAIMKDFDLATEQDLFAATAQMYYTGVPKNQLPDIYQRVIFKSYSGSNEKVFTDYAAHVFSTTFLLDDARFKTFCDNPTLNAMHQDAAGEYALSFVHNFNQYYQPRVDAFTTRKKEVSKQYVRGLMEEQPNRHFYPDANSTMRITYGQVKSYNPQDAVHYDYFTTLDGLMAKYKPGSDEFDVPQQLIDVYKAKDYGRWADADGTLHTGFITTDDITGGNSGSPVINANGEYIGAAFDGNWEAMSGDIAFDKTYKRTIVCDARFILFLIDKLGHAENLIEEMDIRK